jgi:hypothetical protein
MSDELVAALNAVLDKEERERSLSPLIRETAEIECELIDKDLQAAPPTDDWKNWLYRDFYTSNRDRRIEILNNWNACRRQDGPWPGRQQQLEELHHLLDCAGR